jgi:Flp pilus assembly protein TadG
MSSRRFDILASLRRFLRAREGNVAIIFGLALIPIVASVGAAIDFSRANSVKTDLQASLDAAALMLSRDALGDSPDQLNSKALAYVKANFNRPGTSVTSVSADFTSTGGFRLRVNGTVRVPTDFMNIFGQDYLNVSTSSTTAWGSTRLRVALVLDNTGSMAQAGKIGALRSATVSLLGQLKNAAYKDGDVYVSIIPFVKDVSFGPGAYQAKWIDWTDWDASNGTCKNYQQGGGWGGGWGGGRGGGWGGGWGSPNDKASCLQLKGTWTPDNHQKWNGCVVDRGDSNGPNVDNYDTNVVAPNINVKASLYAAEQYSSCPQASRGLSYDWDAMNTLVNNMQPAGNTNQAIGLQVGWMSLVGGGPFTVPPMDSDYTYQQIIILLTDGLNTEDRWYTNQSSIDARQQLTCNNVKAAGITLYTIQVNTGGDPTSTLLQNCASTPDKFTLLTSADQIAATFQKIGNDLTRLRVAQ